MTTSTLGLGGGGFLGVGLRQATTIVAPDITGINTFNGLSVTFYSPYGEQIATLTAGRGAGVKLESEMTFSKYGNLESFDLMVKRNIDIPFFNGMNTRFYFKNLPFAYGYIELVPPTDQTSSVISLRGYGYSKKLNDKKITATYSSSTVSAILADLGSTYFLDLGINYNPTKLQSPVLSVSSATWDDKSIIDIIDDLVSMCNTAFSTVEYIYGVDESGDFYFKGIGTDTIEKAYFEGWNYQNPETEYDAESLINKVLLFRTTSGDNKTTEYVNTYTDSDSIDKYGIYDKKITVPDYIDNTTAENIANGVIAEWKDPKYRITVSDLIINNVLPFAYYTVTNKRQDQIIVDSEFASDTEWGGDYSAYAFDIIDTNVLTGRLCFEWTISGDLGDSITKSVEYYMPSKLRLYIRQQTAGEFLSLSVTGKSRTISQSIVDSGGDNLEVSDGADLVTFIADDTVLSSININVPVINEWIYADLDLTGWFRIDTIAITVINNDPNVILLDRLEIFTNSYISRELSLEKINYVFNANSIKCKDATFGKKKLTLTEKLETVDKKNNIPYDIFSKQ